MTYYKQLTEAQRYQIAALLKAGQTKRSPRSLGAHICIFHSWGQGNVFSGNARAGVIKQGQQQMVTLGCPGFTGLDQNCQHFLTTQKPQHGFEAFQGDT